MARAPKRAVPAAAAAAAGAAHCPSALHSSSCACASPQVWGVKLATMLEDRDVGVLLGLTTLLLGVASRSYEGEARRRRVGAVPGLVECAGGAAGSGVHCDDVLLLRCACRARVQWPFPALAQPAWIPAGYRAGYEACVPRIVRVLERCKQRDVSQVSWTLCSSAALGLRPDSTP